MAIDVPDWLQLTQLAAPGLLGQIIAPAGGSPPFTTYALSPFATGIVVVPVEWGGVVGIEVAGSVTGFIYGTWTSINQQLPPIVVPIAGAVDNPIQVIVTNTALAPGPNPQLAAVVYQLFGAGVQQVSNSPQQPLYVQTSLAPAPGAGVPALKAIGFGVNQAAGVITPLIAAVAGQTITVYGWQCDTFPAVAAAGSWQARIEDSAGGVAVARLRTNLATAVGQIIVPHALSIPLGLPLSAGTGLRLVASAANPSAFFTEGTLQYTQQ